MANLNRVIDIQIALPGGGALLVSVSINGIKLRTGFRLVDRNSNVILMRGQGDPLNPQPEPPVGMADYVDLRDGTRIVTRFGEPLIFRDI